MKQSIIERAIKVGGLQLACFTKCGGVNKLEETLRKEFDYWTKYFGLDNSGLRFEVSVNLNKRCNGYFNPNAGLVYINLVNINNRSVEDYKRTVLHEIIHAVQFSYFYKETKESSRYSHDIDYANSSLEANARAFANKLYKMRENNTLLSSRQTIAWIEEDFMYRYNNLEKVYYGQANARNIFKPAMLQEC